MPDDLRPPEVLDVTAETELDARTEMGFLLDNMAEVLVAGEAAGRLRSREEEALVDSLVTAAADGREEQLGLLARDRLGLLLSPRYVSILRSRLESVRSEEERQALQRVNDFVVSVANSTQRAVGDLHTGQLAKVQALCQAAARGGDAGVQELAEEMHEAGKLDADFVNWLDLAIRAAEAQDGNVPTQWQLVLRVIQKGVHALLQADYARDIATLREVMSVPPAARRDLVWTLLADMPGDAARQLAATIARILGSLAYERDPTSRQLHEEMVGIQQSVEAWFASPFSGRD